MSSNNDRTSSNSFLGFVPSLVIKNILDEKKLKINPTDVLSLSTVKSDSTSKKETINPSKISNMLPIKQELRSVVMFADISGFTNLTENYSKIGPEGNEIIAFAINRYMELMV